jgi:hypothetical protein
MMRRAAWIMILVLEKRLRPPFSKHPTGVPQLVEEESHPKVFELECSWSSSPIVIGKKERAMVRQGGRKGMENVSVEAKIPFGVGVEGI